MHEIRQDLTTGQWVIYATERRDRPVDVHRRRVEMTSLPSRDAHCPFCQAREAALPEVVMELPNHDGDSWQTRVVRNKYPVVVPEAAVLKQDRGIYKTMTAYGLNEIIIEAPAHDADVSAMSPQEVQAIIETYHKRYVGIYAQDDNIRCIIIFRNRGERAGTSLLHPHSQLVATAFVPGCISVQEQRARDYFNNRKSCLFCDIVRFEQESRVRVVFENESFIAFVPFAAEVPFQIWIAPKAHQGDFGSASDHDRAALAETLRDSLQKLEDRVQSPDYNYIVNSFSKQAQPSAHLHWYMEIRPRLVTAAGFEIGSGVRINHSIPEEDAEILRRA
jgi:UDPglucose--hexose-1-phosphate uridylyltransferase